MFKDFYKGSIIIFGGLIIGKFVAMANNVLMARLLSTHHFGIFLIGFTVFRFITIPANFGIPSIMPKFVSESIATKQYTELTRYVSQGLMVTFLFSTILAATAIVGADWIAHTIFHSDELGPVIKVMSIAVPFGVLFAVLIAIHRGLQKNFTKVILQDVLLLSSKCILFILLFYYGLNLKAAYFSFTASYIIVFCVALITVLAALRIKPVKFLSVDVKIVREIIKLSWPLSIQSFIWIIYSQIDRVFIGYFLSPSQVGIYVASFSIVLLLSFLPQAFSYQALPTFSKLFSKNDKSAYKLTYQKVSKVLFLVSFPLLVCISIFAKEIITVLYGNDYIDGALVLVILNIGYFSRCIIGPASESLVTIGKTQKPMIATLAGCIANVILNLLLIPRFGIYGAAIATSISVVLSEIFMGFFNYKFLHIIPFDFSYVIWATICIGLIPAVSFLYTHLNMGWYILDIALCCTIYLIISYSILYFLFYKQAVIKTNLISMR